MGQGAVSVPYQQITDLGQMTLGGLVDPTGDQVTFSSGSVAMAWRQGEPLLDIAVGWQRAEFNVLGNGGGSRAVFNPTPSPSSPPVPVMIVPKTQVIYGGTTAPTCAIIPTEEFSGEKNNLHFGPTKPAPATPGPALLFMESSAGSEASFCNMATCVGDTHITTFDGLLYDFQASGDFTLAQVDPDFVVQNRQVSGTLSLKNASVTVNSAVATQMGETRVAVCLAPTPLNIDGKFTDLDDGKYLSLPDGVNVWRTGNVYYIQDRNGNSVRAEVYPSWINVFVGLGTWPAKVRGLLANANGNVNELETRDGKVLQIPIPFDELYRTYGDSWRVLPEESLLLVCGDGKIQSGNPAGTFYANDLPTEVYNNARAICTKAGVEEGSLLDACTLDVGVSGNETAANVYVGMPAPVAVATVVATPQSR